MNRNTLANYRLQQRPDIQKNFRASRSTSLPPLSSSLNRLFSAAVASSRFRHFLLADPVAAVSAGYNGESFSLTADEIAHVAAIQATSLRDFAAQLSKRFQLAEAAPSPSTTPERSRMTGFSKVGMVANEEQALGKKKLPLKRL